MSAEKQLEIAKKHLLRVQEAWDSPAWDDLSLYGFYCLENAVTAAATHANIPFKKTHPAKVDAARRLAAQHGLPNVEDLLKDLNEARKSEAYGDIASPELDAEDVASEIERYVEAVETFLRKETP
ncbi:MAG TPA: HEPN domain-containing protein [Chthoniobacterales bacterium]|nr:HEPN domain-containing protein [Chthoniobacterales bacterium]